MHKIVSEFIRQNKYLDFTCDNCKTTIKRLSSDVFKKNKYEIKCPKCGNKNIFDTKDFEKKLIKNMPSMLKK